MLSRLTPWIVHAKGRELCEIFLSVENSPGRLVEALRVLAKHHVNILHISGHALPEWERAPVLLFVDVTGRRHVLEELKEELEAVTGAPVRYQLASVEGLMMDELTLPLCALPGVRSIVVGEDDLASMLRGIYERMADVGRAFIFNLAYFGGRSTAEYLAGRLDLAGEELIRECLKVYQATGLGRVELVSYNPEEPRAILRMHDSIECKAFRGQGRPASHYIRGHLSGLLSRLLDEELLAVEVKCVAAGDAYCEFEVIRAPSSASQGRAGSRDQPAGETS